MLNNKTIQVMKRINKEAPETRPVLKNYNIKEGVLWMTDGKKAIWTPSDIKDGLYTIEGENVTETAGTYPDVARLIPSDHRTSIKVSDVKNLLEFVKAFIKLHGLKRSDRQSIVMMTMKDNNVSLMSESDNNAVYMSYSLSCDYMTDSTAYYNPFYLIDILEFISANTSDNKATIKYQGSIIPLVIETSNGAGALVMPIRKN